MVAGRARGPPPLPLPHMRHAVHRPARPAAHLCLLPLAYEPLRRRAALLERAQGCLAALAPDGPHQQRDALLQVCQVSLEALPGRLQALQLLQGGRLQLRQCVQVAGSLADGRPAAAGSRTAGGASGRRPMTPTPRPRPNPNPAPHGPGPRREAGVGTPAPATGGGVDKRGECHSLAGRLDRCRGAQLLRAAAGCACGCVH